MLARPLQKTNSSKNSKNSFTENKCIRFYYFFYYTCSKTLKIEFDMEPLKPRGHEKSTYPS